MHPMTPPVLTTREAAALLGVSASRVRQLVRGGELATERLETPRGPVLRFRAEDVAAFQRRPRGNPNLQRVAAPAAGKEG